MNKYKELIDVLLINARNATKNTKYYSAEKLKQAAQAIKTLLKERDDAINCLHKCGIYLNYENSDISDTIEEQCEDKVNHPAHYTQGGIECIDALKAATEGLTGIEAVCTANAIKYMWRWKWKNGTEDIDKAIWYLNRLKKEINTEKEKEEMNNERA